MKRKMPLLLLLFPLAISGCSFQEGNTMVTFSVGEQSLMKIGELECPISLMKVFLANYQNIYGEAYGLDLWKHDFGDQDLESYVKELSLSEMARILTMDSLAESQGITLTESEISESEEAAREYFGTLSEAEKAWTEITEERLTELYQDYCLAEKLYNELTEGVNYEISEDEARVITVQEIYVTDPATAGLIQSELNAGTDFSTLAAQYNESGQIEKNIRRGDLPAAVEEAVFALENDGYTQGIAVDTGWYFIKCVNKNVEELTAENKRIIAGNREKDASNDVYDNYVSELDSSLNTDLWDSVELVLDGSIKTRSFFTIYEKHLSQ